MFTVTGCWGFLWVLMFARFTILLLLYPKQFYPLLGSKEHERHKKKDTSIHLALRQCFSKKAKVSPALKWSDPLEKPEPFTHWLPWLYSVTIPIALLKLSSFFLPFFPPYPGAVGEFGRMKDRDAFCQEHRIARFKAVAAWLLWRMTTTKKQRRHDGLTDSLLCLFTTRSDVP